jgi:hypothetical protein
MAALFHPARKIRFRNPIGPREHGAFRLQQAHLRAFIHHLLRIISQRERIRPVVLVELLQVVLHDEHAAGAGVIQQAFVGGLEFGTHGIGPRAKNDGVVRGEIPLGDVARGQNADAHSEILEGLRHVVPGARQIAYAQARRRLHVHAHRAVDGWAVIRIGAQTRISGQPVSLLVALALIFGDCRDAVLSRLHRVRHNREGHGLVLAIAIHGERGRLRRRMPTCRQAQSKRAARRSLDVAVYGAGESEGRGSHRNRARGRGHRHGNCRAHQQRLGFHSQARNAMHALDYLRKMHGGALV